MKTENSLHRQTLLKKQEKTREGCMYQNRFGKANLIKFRRKENPRHRVESKDGGPPVAVFAKRERENRSSINLEK